MNTRKPGIVSCLMAAVLRAAILCAAVSCVALGFASCSRMSESSLKLQPNPILTGGIGWAVVKDGYVRLKEAPSSSSKDVDHLRRGGVYRLDARDFGAVDNSAKTQDREMWYGIESEGVKGWVRDSDLEVYGSQSQAEKAAAAFR